MSMSNEATFETERAPVVASLSGVKTHIKRFLVAYFERMYYHY